MNERTIIVHQVSNGHLLQLHVGNDIVREAVHTGDDKGLGGAIKQLFGYRIRGKKKDVPAGDGA